jgi:2-succinyl-5-enolpyruvyl-6-hydroxy-3-cyclohexene-1-carboxylate synthase
MTVHSIKKSVQQLSSALRSAGIKDIVISPGSRNAPLIIEFTGSNFNNFSIIDERSAGFFALGMAQQKQKPVVLVCTSGSALLNYYPAVAEAFYSHIPLLIISADRPQKWVDHGEGQTIRQDQVFSNHSWYNITLNESETNEALQQNHKEIKKAIETAIEKRGPVHINVPFDEPLYESITGNIDISFDISPNIDDRIYEVSFLEDFARQWNGAKRKMILAGQHHPSDFLQLQLERLAQDPSVIVLNENISNVYHPDFINNIDRVIFSLDDESLKELQPEILITTGRNIISKKVKYFLRKFSPAQHWHIEKTFLPPDTFEVLSQHFHTAPEMFFSQFLFLTKDNNNSDFRQKWLKINREHYLLHQKYLAEIPFSDLKFFELLSKHIPENYMLQWGNSSTVRYAQLFDYQSGIVHFSNRGTSGIDGSISTAVGAAFATKRPVLAVTGDISFLYDSNALWNKYIPNNFKIILINNGGGDIFNFIPGPANTKALDDFFVTKHASIQAGYLARMYGFAYQRIDNLPDLDTYLPEFFASDNQPQILEIDTGKVDNAKILKEYFNNFH